MKILVAGAGGAPSEGVIRSIQRCPKGETVLGMGSEPTDLVLSAAEKKFVVPYANAPEYRETLLRLLEKEKPDFVHFQNDAEIFVASALREDIHSTGTKTFMPRHEVIDTCVHKYKTYLALEKAGVKVPKNLAIGSRDELRKAFKELGDSQGRIWLRASSIGGGGKGALPTNDYDFAVGWIERYKGWGDFIAAEMLTADTVTWLSIWWEGELICAQTRTRKGWTHGNRTVSGVTGVTKVGQTTSDEKVTEISKATVKAVDAKPHGIYGVDMTYDAKGVPNPTEINISRFFTTVLFFTEAGFNMPKIVKDLVLYGERPTLERIVNPLPDGLLWLRGMDTPPRLMTEAQMKAELVFP